MAKTVKTSSKKLVETPSILSFPRAIEPTDAFFYQMDSANKDDQKKPVVIQERVIRTTKSYRFKEAVVKNEDTFKKEAASSNIQKTQVAYLNTDCDTLVVEFGLKILPFCEDIEACNSKAYKTRLMQIIRDYAKETEFRELSERYATNIANARWLWRNRYISHSVKVMVTARTDNGLHEFEFDARAMSLKEANASHNPSVKALAKLIADAFSGEQFLSLAIKAEADMGYGHQVFPSEEMNLAEFNTEDERQRSKKQLFSVNGVASMHSVKVGNAIRTIDSWYEGYEENGSLISIEVYGAVTRIAEAFRMVSTKKDFYSLLDRWVERDEEPSIEDKHYVMAVLIRGGLFGKSGK